MELAADHQQEEILAFGQLALLSTSAGPVSEPTSADQLVDMFAEEGPREAVHQDDEEEEDVGGLGEADESSSHKQATGYVSTSAAGGVLPDDSVEVAAEVRLPVPPPSKMQPWTPLFQNMDDADIGQRLRDWLRAAGAGNFITSSSVLRYASGLESVPETVTVADGLFGSEALRRAAMRRDPAKQRRPFTVRYQGQHESQLGGVTFANCQLVALVVYLTVKVRRATRCRRGDVAGCRRRC